MTTTQISYALYTAAFLILVGLVLRWLFAAQIDWLMKRYFPDFVARRTLRAEQQFEDRAKARRRERELEEQRLLDWAYAHPNTPEGRRRLLKEREAVLKRLERANRDAEHRASMVGYTRGDDKAAYEAELADARQRQNDEARQLADLDRALSSEDAAVSMQ